MRWPLQPRTQSRAAARAEAAERENELSLTVRKMMKQFAGFGTKKLNPKNRGGKSKKGKKRGGRVTEKGPAKVSKAPLSLPGLEDALQGLDDGDFPGLK